MATTGPRATPKQISYLSSLLDCREYDVPKRVESLIGERTTGIGRYLTMSQASRTIDRLRASTASTAGADTMADA